MMSFWEVAHCPYHCSNVRFADGSTRPNNNSVPLSMSLTPRQNCVRQLSEVASSSGASCYGRHWCLTPLTLIVCAALVFCSGVDHNHTSPDAMEQDCVVCDFGNAKLLAAVCASTTLLAFGFANEVNWPASNPFPSRYRTTTPRAPPPQLAFS